MTNRPRTVLLGRQGAGKGTQAARLATHYGVPHLSTGDIFRDAIKKESPLGLAAAGFMDRGELIPDDVVLGVIRDLFAAGDVADGFVFDGFPRTAAQGRELGVILETHGVALDLVIDLEVSTEIVLHRLAGRRVCTGCGATYHVDAPPTQPWVCDGCGGAVVQREDDTEAAIARRLELYEVETAPLSDFYRQLGLLVTVDGVGSAEEVSGRLVAAVDAAMDGQSAAAG